MTRNAILLLAAAACVDGKSDEPTDPVSITVEQTSPEDGSTDVPLDTVIEVVFDGPITGDPAAGLVLVPDQPGTASWDADLNTLTFDPSGPLAAGIPYSVRLTTALGLAADQTFGFTTVSDPIVPPDPVDPDHTWTFGNETAGLTTAGDNPRTYTLSTTASLRDTPTPGGERTFTEPAGPTLRSGNLLLDALFALALVETDEASVSQISDGSFNGGAPVDCDCFETGELWTWVWTRDTAYAADLGLAMVDPIRTANSLRFKLSAAPGEALQIVQDTGTGGSWPVSTDRAIWALGARQTLRWLPPAERASFQADALEAMATTIAMDRDHVYDAVDGLYRGEQSFLDWREQSYPSWTATDTVHIAMSKSLSTNLAHLILLQTAAELGAGSHPDALTWQTWADALRDDIRTGFWDAGQLSALRTTTLDDAPLQRWELLGNSLAVLEGVVTGEEAASVVRSYPHGPLAPPVFWPQLPDVPIYHNRGSWPFVTSYGLLAATRTGNDAVFDRDMNALLHGAALNLSHMENFEFLSMAPWFDDGDNSGPVVNSRRQLWSVAGFIGAVLRGVMGVDLQEDGLTIAPHITSSFRDTWLADSGELTLDGLRIHEATVSITVQLPAMGLGAGFLSVDEIRVDGMPAQLPLTPVDGAAITVVLGAPSGGDTLTEADPAATFSPREPTGLTITTGDPIGLSWQAVPNATYTVYKDGVPVVTDLTETSWTDDGPRGCYAVEAQSSVGTSHHTPPACAWAAGSVMEHDAYALVQTSGAGVWSTTHGRAHYENWGDPGDTLTRFGLTTHFDGEHLLQLDYGNGAGGFTSGIAAGHKRIEVYDEADESLVAAGSVVLPQRDAWDNWGRSSFLRASLQRGRSYRVEVHHAPNMTPLEHYTTWGGTGGGVDGFHRVNISALVVLALEGDAAAPDPAVVFTGTDDLSAYPESQRLPQDALGDPLEPWSAFAVDWDDDWLYLTLVSRGFEDDYAPWMIYLDTSDASPTAGTGMDYVLGSVSTPAALPFTPTHLITARAVAGAGPDDGPWNGLWTFDGSYQQRLRLREGEDLFLAADRHTMSVRVPRSLLGGTTLRLAAHMLHGDVAVPWSDRVPADHDPATGGGGWLTLDLSASDHTLAP